MRLLAFWKNWGSLSAAFPFLKRLGVIEALCENFEKAIEAYE